MTELNYVMLAINAICPTMLCLRVARSKWDRISGRATADSRSGAPRGRDDKMT